MTATTSGGSSILTELGTPGAVQSEPAALAPAANGTGGNGQTPAQVAADKAWWAEYEAEFKEDPGFSKIKSYENPKGVVKAYMNLEKLLGGEKVPKPRADDDVEGWDRWYRATGRPDKGEEYEFKRPDSMPENFYSEDIEKEFRTWAYENGLSKKQAANMHDRYVNTRLKAHQEWQKAQGEQRSQAELALKRQFGDKFEAAQNRTKAAYQKYADPEFAKYLEETGLGNDPRMIRVFEKIGAETMGEVRLKGAAMVDHDPADAERAIANHREKYREALFKRDHPDHDLRVKEMKALFEKRFGE